MLIKWDHHFVAENAFTHFYFSYIRCHPPFFFPVAVVVVAQVDMLATHHQERKEAEEAAPAGPNMGMQHLMLTGPGNMMQQGGMGFNQHQQQGFQ